MDRAELPFHVPISVHTEITTPMATVDSVHHPKTGTWQYIIADIKTLDAVVIDPVMDFDAATRTVTTETADRLVALVKKKGYRIVRILETHVHTDHVTAASYLQSVLELHQAYRPAVCIGRRIRDAQQFFGPKYDVPGAELSSAFDRLLEDDEVFSIGELEARVVHLPGHTADHVGYIIGENVFCGESVLNADLGTARCDFPGGSSKAMYESTRKLLGLPSRHKLWTGHDDPRAAERQCPVPYMSVGEQRQGNRHVHEHVTEQTFQQMRDERDAGFGDLKLLHASLQINMRGGRLPKPTPQGQYHLRLPQLGFGDCNAEHAAKRLCHV